MDNLELYGVMAIPLVTGMIQMLTSSRLPKKLAPLVSLTSGIGIGMVGFADGNMTQGVVIGCAIGLSASGFYSAVKMPFKKEGE